MDVLGRQWPRPWPCPRDIRCQTRTLAAPGADGTDSAIALIKPGVGTDRIAHCFPTAQDIGFESEKAAFGLNFCHGLGLGLHERPSISRLSSFDEPMELVAGMVFAVETYCPADDGVSAARIEEEVIVTPRGAQIITLFAADELPIANRY